MTGLVFFVEQGAIGLYILIGGGIFWAWWHWNRARGDWRATRFELERDIYRDRQANWMTILILLLEIGLVILGIQRVVAPAIRSTLGTSVTIAQIAQDGSFETPVPTPVNFGNSPIDASGVNLVQEDQSNQVQATTAPTQTPVGTILPNPPPVAGCDTPNAMLQVPGNGMLVFEPIIVVGTANADNFAFYRFEIKGPSTFGNFAQLRDYDRPVTEVRQLGQFVPAFYQPGEYQFRLTVFDITNMLKAACTVNITVSLPIPTATPIQSP